MKKITYLTFILVLLISATSFSQQSNKTKLESEYISNKTVNLLDNPNNYTGSPYYNVAFSNGHIYKNGKLLVANIKLRYNAYKDEFEIQNSINPKNTIVNTLFRKKSLSVKIGIQEFKFIRPSEKNKVYGYVIPLVKDTKISVYKKIKKKYTPAQQATSSMDTNIAAFYREKTFLYFVNQEGYFTEVPTSKSKRLELFSTLKKEMKVYLKENKLNIKKEKDFIKLVKYYNTL